MKLFADDTFLCAQNKDCLALESEVNAELDKVSRWLSANKLTLNVKKSKYMLITNKRNVPGLNLSINSSPLESCDSYKYLGVFIDKGLSWSTHIEYLCKKIAKGCGGIAKLRHCVSINILKNVYHALIHSYLRYGIIVWGNASQNTLKPLQTIVNKVKALRIMTFAPFGNLDLTPMYDFLKVLNIKQIFLLECGKFQYKFHSNLLPITIGGYF